MNITISLDLPVNFQKSCKALDIRSETTIQSFINSISIYSFMVTSSKEQCSVASSIFGYYLRSADEKIKPIANPEKRDMGLYYIRLIVQLTRHKCSRNKKEEIYEKLIDEWYSDLLKINGA
jgi:hypothetical protein